MVIAGLSSEGTAPVTSVGVLSAVEALLQQGLKPQARACAHEALDRGDPDGPAAAALVACREGFHRLAWSLLARLDTEADDGLLHSLRLESAWRLGIDEAPALVMDLLNPDQLASLLEVAVQCHRTADMARLAARLAVQQGAANSRAREVMRWLDGLGVVGRDPSQPESLQRIVVATLPPALGHSDAADAVVRRWRKAASSGNRAWFGLVPKARRARSQLAFDRLQAAADRLGDVPSGALVLLLDGVIDRHNAGHWLAALQTWPSVLVSGLRIHDPAAAVTPDVLAALQRHAPIGVRDWSTFYLLRDAGIECCLSGGLTGAPPPVNAATRLWNEGEGAKQLVEAVAAIEAGLRDGAVIDVATWRAAWATQPAVLPDVERSLPEIPASHGRDPIGSTGAQPSWPPDALHVAMAVDAQLAQAALVAIESCRLHSRLPLCIHLLIRGIDQATQDEWRQLFAGQLTLQFHPCDEIRHGDHLHLISHTSESTLDRLLLPQLLPTLDRVIYLDVDLVVLADLEPLWRLALDDRPLAAKPSSSPRMEWGTQMIYHALAALPEGEAAAWRHRLHQHGSLTFRAFNAGVLVLNLAQMRRDGASELTRHLVRHAAMNDQDALNCYAGTRYLALEAGWNAAPRQDPTAEAKIIHFVGPVKPWHELYISRKDEYERIRGHLEQRKRQRRDD